MKTYTIERVTEPVPLDDRIEGTPWEQAAEFTLSEFNWYEQGPRPVTTGRAVYDDRALYLQFHVEDPKISAAITELNGPTFQDSSVEFFADPNPEKNSKYCNFEPNCCGHFKIAWQEKDWQPRGIDRDLISPELAAAVEVRTPFSSIEEANTTDADSWWLAAALPFDVLRSFTGVDIDPDTGTEWRGNFYRSGVQSASQKATWNPIETPEPDYHSPEFFGKLRFG